MWSSGSQTGKQGRQWPCTARPLLARKRMTTVSIPPSITEIVESHRQELVQRRWVGQLLRPDFLCRLSYLRGEMRDYQENREHIRGYCTWARLSEQTGIWQDLEPQVMWDAEALNYFAAHFHKSAAEAYGEKRCVSSHLISFLIWMSEFSAVSCFRSFEIEFFILSTPFPPSAMGIKSTARYTLGKHSATKLHQPRKQKQIQISGSCDPLEERSQKVEISVLESQERTPRTPRMD